MDLDPRLYGMILMQMIRQRQFGEPQFGMGQQRGMGGYSQGMGMRQPQPMNLNRQGPRGPRTWDFYGTPQGAHARIFSTGEDIPLGNMEEDDALEYLKGKGKL